MESNAKAESPDRKLEIRLPEHLEGFPQDQEWFEVRLGGAWRRMRIHDYAGLYRVPGLYESLVYRTLRCRSPRRLVRLLVSVLEDWPVSAGDLRVLDLGAGNGVVAERLREVGAEAVVGVDIIREARDAAERDRPGVYDDYLICDLTDPSEEDLQRMRDASLNCLITVAALGFGDIPPDAFANAFNVIRKPGWLAMTIKEDFLKEDDDSGFSKLIRRALDGDLVRIESYQRYCHRRSVSGEPIFYLAVVARAMKDIPSSMVREAMTSGRHLHVGGEDSDDIFSVSVH